MAGVHTLKGAIGRRDPNSARGHFRTIVQALLFGSISAMLFWLVAAYGNALRDPRYLDGWVLAGGMGVQLYFHVATATGRLTPKAAARWRSLHIFFGLLLVPVFLLHSNFSLPDTNFEWALWIAFVLICLSGLFGIYISWSLKSRHMFGDDIVLDRIPEERAKLAREVQAIAARIDQAPAASALPPPPHDAWIRELYASRLIGFFSKRRNAFSHLIGSKRPLKQLTDEIDHLTGFVDKRGQEKLRAIRRLVIEKDRLDAANVALGLSRAWLLVHVPVTYSIVILAVVHILVVYSFSSGAY